MFKAQSDHISVRGKYVDKCKRKLLWLVEAYNHSAVIFIGIFGHILTYIYIFHLADVQTQCYKKMPFKCY